MNFPVGLILTILMSAFLPTPVQAYDFQECVDCHDETLDSDATRMYLHSPFAEKQCEECHAAKASIPTTEEITSKALSAGVVDRRKINWLGDSATVDTSHGFLLQGDKAGHTLVVELHGIDDKFSRHEIIVPSLAYLPEVKDSGKPPAISEVRVLKVERGVFLKVTVGWQTDTLTDALVRYGNQDISQTSESGKRLGRQHQVVLYNLQPDRTYQFSVVSHDLFGRSQVSEPMTFSTSQPLTTAQPENLDNLPEDGDEVGMTSNFQRLGAGYLLELRLEHPASIYIGSKGVIREQRLSVGSTSAMGGDHEFHAGLSSEVVISLQACQSCHQTYYTAAHPVNVYPKPGMTIPSEYPTLPDGRITCRSCHASHGSDYANLTRKRGRRELCVGCHHEML